MATPPVEQPRTGDASDTRRVLQRRFHRTLQDLLGSAASPKQPIRFLSGLLGSTPSLELCQRTSTAYQAFAAEPAKGGTPRDFLLPAYPGTNPVVQRIAQHLTQHAAPHLDAAILHGSLASNDEIPYSDFDGLVILADATLRNPRTLQAVAGELRATQILMGELDPLQHHGWFALSAADLEFYPDDLLPHPVYEFSTSLYPTPCSLALRPRDSRTEFRNSFTSAAGGVQRRARSQDSLRNLYQLKCTLSQFMLLPALYLQARDGQGVHKKFSFAAAENDFTEEQWRPMREASALRLAWPKVEADVWCRISHRFPPLRRLLLQRLGPRIPQALRSRIPADLFNGMIRLADAMAQRLGLTPEHAAR